MAIYILRHGLSEGNAQRVFQGRRDMELTDTGRKQARTAGRWLAARGVKPAVVYASPLSRAGETAQIISAELGGPEPLRCDEIAEFDAGELEGLPVDEVEQRHPDYFVRELGKRGDFSEYGGESYAQMQARLEQFTGRFSINGDNGRDTIIVSHGGTIYQLLKLWCCWPSPRHFFNRIGNCSCYKLELREFPGHLGAELIWMVPLELMEG